MLYVALALLLRDRLRPFPAWLTIDGVLAGLRSPRSPRARFRAVRDATEAYRVVATTLAYLVCDLLMLVLVLVTFAATAWGPGAPGGSSGPRSSCATRRLTLDYLPRPPYAAQRSGARRWSSPAPYAGLASGR